MIVYRVNLFLLIVFLFVQIQDATPRGDSTSSIRSPQNPLISYRFDEEDNIDKKDSADTNHANSHEDIESDEKSNERSFQNPSRRRPTRFRDFTISSTTSIRSPTNRLIAYRLDEGEKLDKNDYGEKSHTSSHSRKNKGRHEDYYDYADDEKKKKKSGEKSTENQETSTESQELSTHLLVASQETTIRSPTHRLISYRVEESDHIPTHQFQKAKKVWRNSDENSERSSTEENSVEDMAVLQPKPVEQTFNYKFTPQPKTSSEERSISNDNDFSSLYSSYLRSRTTSNYPTEDRDTEPIRSVQATYHYRTEAPPTYQYPYTGYSSSRYQPATSYTYDNYRYPAYSYPSYPSYSNTPSYGYGGYGGNSGYGGNGGYGGNAFAINSGFNIGGLGIGSGLGISLG